MVDVMEHKRTHETSARKAAGPINTERLNELLTHRHESLPVWFRAPVKGPDKYTGLTRSYLYKLDSLGLIQSRCIIQPGKVRGCRLFNLPSVLEFIEKSGSGKAVVL